MDSETVKAAMVAELDEVHASALARVFDWRIEANELTAYCHLHARQVLEPLFLLRVSFEDFPSRAPSCVFVDQESLAASDAAWPPGVRHGRQPPGICTPGTREFHEHYHLNDRQHVWSHDRYPLLQTLAEINRLLERGLGR
jgi:hypothetical protein